MKAEDNSIWVETLVSQRTGEPLIQIAWYDHTGQLSPQEARQLAIQLLEAADAATSDAFLCRFLAEKLDAPKKAQAAILHEFRLYREKLGHAS